MEKRFFLALALSMAVLLLWGQIFPGPKPTPKPATDSEAPASPTPAGPVADTPTPAATTETVPQDVPVAEPMVLENDLLKVVTTQRGATIESAWLKDYWSSTALRRSGGEPLQILMPSDADHRALRLEDLSRPSVGLGSKRWREVAREAGRSVTYEFRYTDGTSGEGAAAIVVTKTLRLPPGRARHLEVAVDWRIENRPAGDALERVFGLLVSGGVYQDPRSDSLSVPRSAFYPVEGSVRLIDATTVLDQELEQAKQDPRRAGLAGTFAGALPSQSGAEAIAISGDVRFAADCSNYFGAFLVMKDFPGGLEARVHSVGRNDKGATIVPETFEQGIQGVRTASVVIVRDRAEAGTPRQWKGLYYLGPFDPGIMEESLKGVVSDAEVEALATVHDEKLGMARSVARVILSALRGLHSLVGNWGFAIILLTVCVRLLLFPLNRKSQAAMLRMQEAHARIKPKLDKLKEKYKDDPKRMAAEQMALFRAEKVPMVPLGGCLPLFLQMPVFFGLFSALSASVDLRQATWWWVADLSQPDRLIPFGSAVFNPMSLCFCFPQPGTIDGIHLLPILMTGAWFASSMLAPKPVDMTPEMAQQRKMMMFMPVVFGLMMYTYAAGLSLYWLTSSLIGIFESRLIKKLIAKKAA